MNGIELGLHALAGGITGYVTNTTAVKMIFKKVFGFGGLIIETREEFIENVSELVERDVINHGTLQSQLSKAEFNREITKIVNDFLQNQLYDVTQNKSLNQIPKMPKSLKDIFGFFSEQQGEMIKDVFKLLSEAISVQDLLSEKQFAFLTGQIIDACIDIVRETEILDSFILNIYEQYKDETLSDVIPSTVIEVVIENINKSTTNIHSKIQANSNTVIQQLLDDIYTEFDISLVVAELEKSLKNKTIVELFGHTHAENMSNELLQHIIQFLKSPPGQNLLKQTSEYLFGIIKEVRAPLFNLFKPELAGSLESFLASKLPGVVEQLILWFKDNQDWLEERIEEALQSTLAQETTSRAWLKKVLYEQFAKKSLVTKFQIVSKLIEGIKDNVDVHILSEEISSLIITYLRNTDISDMIYNLESNGIFTSQDITLLIESNMEKFASQVDLKATDSYFNKKLGELLQLPIAEPIESYVKGILLKFKQEFLYTSKFTEVLQRELKIIMQEVSTQKFKNIILDETFEDNIPQFKKGILEQLDKHRDRLVTILVHESQTLTGDKKLNDILYPNIEDKIAEKISEKINLYSLNKLEELQQKSIYSVYDSVNAMPNLGTRLARGGTNLLNNNLETITKGQIESIVSSNLSKRPNKQLQDLVEGFMGKELKPISWLGAFLGILAGLGFGLIKSNYGLTSSLSLALSIPVYGLVGYLTNKQALWMIFHPYQPWRIFGKDVPLTQGVIAKNKPRFAKAMAHFVGEELLNSRSSVKLFQDNRQNLSNTLMQSISKNNYQMVQNFLIVNTSVITSELLRAGYVVADKNLETWSRQLVEEIQDIPLKALKFDGLRKTLKVYGLDLPERLQPYLMNKLDGVLQDQRSLPEALPNKSKQLVDREIDRYLDKQLDELQKILTNQQLFAKKTVFTLGHSFSTLTSQSLNELIADEQKEDFKNRIANLISEQLRSEDNRKKIQAFILEKISKELDPNKKIVNLFDGKLFKMFEQNVYPILDVLTAKINILLDNERQNLKRTAKEEARGTSGYEVANSFLNIDGTIDDFVDHLVDKTGPEIISESREDISSYLLRSFNQIGESRINEIKLDLTEQGIVDIVSNLLDNQTLNKQLRILSGGIIESLTDFPLERLLSAAGIETIEDVITIFTSEFNLVREKLNDNLVSNKGSLKSTVSTVATKIFSDLAAGITLNSILEGVDKDDLGWSVEQSLAKIKEGKAWSTAVDEFTDALVTDVNSKKIKEILDSSILQNDLEKVITLLIQDQEAIMKLKTTMERTLKTFFCNLNDLIDIETRDYITCIAIESILNALEQQIPDLVKTLDIKEITEREINNMDPKEIEDLFNSFAKRYFRKLELYGLWGGLLGFLMGILLTRI